MEDFDKLEKQYKKMKEKSVLKDALKMAQQSLPPEKYEKFVEAYNWLIKTRSINLKPI